MSGGMSQGRGTLAGRRIIVLPIYKSKVKNKCAFRTCKPHVSARPSFSRGVYIRKSTPAYVLVEKITRVHLNEKQWDPFGQNCLGFCFPSHLAETPSTRISLLFLNPGRINRREFNNKYSQYLLGIHHPGREMLNHLMVNGPPNRKTLFINCHQLLLPSRPPLSEQYNMFLNSFF